MLLGYIHQMTDQLIVNKLFHVLVDSEDITPYPDKQFLFLDLQVLPNEIRLILVKTQKRRNNTLF